MNRQQGFRILFALLTVAWVIIFKLQSIPDQPVRAFPDFAGYQALAASLRGDVLDSHLEFLLPRGFADFLNLVNYVWKNPPVENIGIGISLAAALIPLAIYLLFVRTVGPLVAFLLSFCYLAADTTLRYETMLDTTTMSSVLLALTFILVWAWMAGRRSRWSLLTSLLLGIFVAVCGTIRPQFLLMFLPVTGSVILAFWLARNDRQDDEPGPGPWHYLSQIILISVPAVALLGFMVYRNVTAESYPGISPLGPFNQLNYSSEVFHDFSPATETELRFKDEMLAAISANGKICTLCSGKDKEIIDRVGVSRGEFYVMLEKANRQVLWQNRDYYLRLCFDNLMRFFGSAGDNDDYADSYLRNFAREHPVWGVPARVLSAIAPPAHPARQLIAGAILFVAGTLIHRRKFDVVFTNALCFSIVAYTAVAVVMSQNAEFFRYRATVQWLWLAYMWWAAFMVVLPVVLSIKMTIEEFNRRRRITAYQP